MNDSVTPANPPVINPNNTNKSSKKIKWTLFYCAVGLYLIVTLVFSFVGFGDNSPNYKTFPIVTKSDLYYEGEKTEIKNINGASIGALYQLNAIDPIPFNYDNDYIATNYKIHKTASSYTITYTHYLATSSADPLAFELKNHPAGIDWYETVSFYVFLHLQNDTTLEDAQAFTYQRSFSLLGTENNIISQKNVHLNGGIIPPETSANAVFGTGWLVKRLTGTSNFHYLIMTNWHVAQGIKDYNLTLQGYAQGKGTLNVTNYAKFIDVNDANVYGHLSNWNGKNYGTDSYLYEVDFGDTSTIPTLTLNNLNALNNLYAKGANMFSLATTVPQEISSQVFVGGYPGVGEEANVEWNFKHRRIEEFDGYALTQNLWEIDPKEGQTVGHYIDDSRKYFSVGNEYWLNYSDQSIMGGGSSGSMAFIHDPNSSTEPFKLIGIYWGNWYASDYNLTIDSIESFIKVPANSSQIAGYDDDGEPIYLRDLWLSYDIYDLFSQLTPAN